MYAELGFGNATFLSTEVERVDGECRIQGFWVGRVKSAYVRVWVGKAVLIVDSHDGVKVQVKPRNGLKLLLGIVSA